MARSFFFFTFVGRNMFFHSVYCMAHNFVVKFQHVQNKTIGFHTGTVQRPFKESGGRGDTACLAGIYNKDDVLQWSIWNDLV